MYNVLYHKFMFILLEYKGARMLGAIPNTYTSGYLYKTLVYSL